MALWTRPLQSLQEERGFQRLARGASPSCCPNRLRRASRRRAWREASWAGPDEEESERWPFDGAAPSAARPAAEGERRGHVTALTRAERDLLLPLAATGAQYAYFFGPFEAALQRAFASLLGGLLTASMPLLAVPAGLYWLWAPAALAARRSAPLRRYACAGIWHARVLQAEARSAGSGVVFDARGDAFATRRRAAAVMRVLLGDASGAQLQLEVPLQSEHRNVRVGDAAEVVVLSDDPDLRRFRAISDAYLPETECWLSEYPFTDRRQFLLLSNKQENQWSQ